MRWHPATGIGVIALGNGTYAPMSPLATQVLTVIVSKRHSAHQVALAPGKHPWPATLAAREEITALLSSVAASGDPAALASREGLLTANVALDRPYAERARDIALLRSRIGDFTDSRHRAPEYDTPAHCRWFLAGERGTVQAQILLSPEVPPRVQSLTLAMPPAEGGPLAKVLDAIVAWWNRGEASWPESVPVTGGADPGSAAASSPAPGQLARRLRMAAAWTGPVTLGAYRAGDGAGAVTVELAGEHAHALLAISVDTATGALRTADVTL
jgi:hypothetical protein